MDTPTLHRFATRYTAAWCGQDPDAVASFFAETGTLAINGGAPAVGRTAIADSARGFMTAFPDLVVEMDELRVDGPRALYRWTLSGTNTGPGGTGNRVRISGQEAWTFGPGGLIAISVGSFDEEDYRRQVNGQARSAR